MTFVIDASMAAAWMLPDESGEATDAVLLRLDREQAVAPSLFWFEMRQLFVTAERKTRFRPGEAAAAMQNLRRLPVEDAGCGVDALIFKLCFAYGLTAYDASYLALAMDGKVPLATLDKKLATAARLEAVMVLGPLGAG